MKLTDHIFIKVNETKDLVLVETTSGMTKLDASSLNKLMMALKPLYFEINPLSRLLWQLIKQPQPELVERILGHFESDPMVSERLQGYLTYLENQISKQLSLIEPQDSNAAVLDEEDERSMRYWESRRQRVVQAKSQWLRKQDSEELLTILAPNLP